MDDMELLERPSIMGRIAGLFSRTEEYEEDETEIRSNAPVVRPNYRYTVTVRKDITSFEDAMAAANGLKRGEQQIINLCHTDPSTRQKIVDFMCGVNYALEGTWEEIGENVYLVVPANAHVEVAPATPRMNSIRN